jgi:hypothetical protein
MQEKTKKASMAIAILIVMGVLTTGCSNGAGVSSEQSSKPITATPGKDISTCEQKKIPFGGNGDAVLYDCVPLTSMGEIKIFRFTEMSPGVANVAAYADQTRPIYDVPIEASAQIIGYGAQKYKTLSLLLPAGTKTDGWVAQGWAANPTPQGTIMNYQKR